MPAYRAIYFTTPTAIGMPPRLDRIDIPQDGWPKLELLESGGIRLHLMPPDAPVDIPPHQIASMSHRDRSATEEFLRPKLSGPEAYGTYEVEEPAADPVVPPKRRGRPPKS